MGFDLISDRSTATKGLSEAERNSRISELYAHLRSTEGVSEQLPTTSLDSTTRSIPTIPTQAGNPIDPHKCRSYLKTHEPQIKQAISNRDIKDLLKLLGPSLYAKKQAVLQAAQENLWQWLQARCKLLILQLKAKVFIDEAKSADWGDVFQTDSLKDTLKRELEALADDIAEVIKAWKIGDKSLEAIVCEKLEGTIKQECESLNSADLSNLPEQLYRLSVQIKKAQKQCQKCHEKGAALEKRYQNVTSLGYKAKAWSNINRILALVGEDEQMSQLKVCGLAETSISDVWLKHEDEEETVSPTDFVEFAISLYLESEDAQDKKCLLGIIKLLLRHGDKPTEEFINQHRFEFDWDLESTILKYLKLNTQFSESIREELASYTTSRDSSQVFYKRLMHWALTTKAANAQQRQDIGSFIAVMCSNRQGVRLDNDLAVAISQAETRASSWLLGTPSLYRDLSLTLFQRKRGELVATQTVPKPEGEGLELRIMK